MLESLIRIIRLLNVEGFNKTLKGIVRPFKASGSWSGVF
jgi:hypothetical protein